MKKFIMGFLNDESGATMVEYAILVALISIAAIVIIALLGNQINATFTQVLNCIQGGGAAAACGPVGGS